LEAKELLVDRVPIEKPKVNRMMPKRILLINPLFIIISFIK